MSLGPGARLGSYEILDSIGAGGMGEVYRARDTRLQRDVAIKVLPELFAADPDRLARFEREAQTLAALNHPNIAQIFGVVDLPAEAGSDTAGARAALVMELVDGEDLAQRLSRGPIALDDAVPVARQIADALEAAHELGIVHRDLKPANIKVRPDGTVKVLDFGLAKAMMPDVAGAGVPVANANSPTFASPAMTAHGVILGTAAYMAPEQARGRPVDRRADIWAFGCVLYEMLTGAGPFAGETVTDVLSAVISREPDWGSLPGATPSALVSLMRRCLEKDPRRRLRDIGEARLILEQPMDAGPTAAALKPARRSRLVPALAVLVVLLAVALVAIAARGFRTTDTTPRTLTRYDVRLPDKTAAMITFRPAVSVSADGSTFTALAAADGLNQVYVRTRADVEFRRIAGTERAVMAAVSPDGRSLAFFADGSLRKASIDGGATTLSAARDVRGLTWVDSVTIVVTPDSAGPLFMVSSSGGEMRPLTTLGAGERTHRWPDALPGGRAVLFTVGTLDKPDLYDPGNIDVVTIATGERHVLIKGAAMARACGPGRVIYSKGTSLYSVTMDPDRLQLTGAPVEIVQGVERDASTGAAHFDCSDDGTLAYIPGSSTGDLRRLAWADRKGQMEPLPLQAGPLQDARVSPDGTRVALLQGASGAGDVWIYETTGGTFTRLSFNGTSAAPEWSPDGRYVYYTTLDASGRSGSIVRKLADGSRDAETLRTLDRRAYISSVDEVNLTVVLDAIVTASDRGDVLRVPLAPGGAPQTLAASQFNEYGSSVSPNGRWIAYQSDETGRPEVYALDLATPGLRRQVTTAGGEEPHWSRDGRELFYRAVNRLMTTPVLSGPTLRFGNPVSLFEGVYTSGIETGRSYDVNPKTGRFLLVLPARELKSTGTIRVVLNWDAASQ